MKLTPQDWRKLRNPLIILGVAFIFTALLVGYAQHYQEQTAQALQTQESQLNQARQRYQSSGMEKETIVNYLPRYQGLINAGFIGEERRIEWVDNLRNIHQENKLFGINYSIASQEDYKPAIALNTGPFALRRSVMTLELSMLHEMDLITLVEALKDKETTPFMPRDCEIKRVATSITDKLAPNLVASCELDWLTIREPQAVGVVSP
jgi:hypothetical protein